MVAWKTPGCSFGTNPRSHGINQQKRLTYQYWQPECSPQIFLTDFKFHWICVCHCCFRAVAGTFAINNGIPPTPLPTINEAIDVIQILQISPPKMITNTRQRDAQASVRKPLVSYPNATKAESKLHKEGNKAWAEHLQKLSQWTL